MEADTAHGYYAFSVDSGPEEIFDVYSPTRQFRQLLFDTEILEPGDHTLTLRVTGDMNPAADRAGAQIDYAEVVVVPVTGIAMDEERLEMAAGTSVRLTASVRPADATEQRIDWSSSDGEVATVAADGTVSTLSPGESEIVATSRDGGIMARRTLIVTPEPTELFGWSETPTSMTRPPNSSTTTAVCTI